jgi:hypothetical protein
MKAGRGNPMEKTFIRQEIVAIMMESPLYFTIPIRKRLDFIKFFSQQPVYDKCDFGKRESIDECNLRSP